jgi:hypothetical protein
MDLRPVISGRHPPNFMMWLVSSHPACAGGPGAWVGTGRSLWQASLVLECYEAIREFSVQKDSVVSFFLSDP